MLQTKLYRLGSILTLALLTVLGQPHGAAAQTAAVRYFPETGHSISGIFLTYWEAHGGLAQQGYPLTDAAPEANPLNGKTYTVQYFERAVFEEHPENQGTPYEVLLSQLGTLRYRTRYPQGAPGQQPAAGGTAFPATGHVVGGAFLTYWQSHGGVAQLGYPVSDELTEVSALNGKSYRVQYFERAELELHPENAPPYDVQAAQLGRFALADRQAAAGQAGGAPATPATPAAATPAPAVPGISGYTASATMANTTPEQYTYDTVIGQLALYGAPVAGAEMQTTWHFQGRDDYCAAVTNDSGWAACQADIGNAPTGVPIVIDIVFITKDGTRVPTSVSVAPAGTRLPSKKP